MPDQPRVLMIKTGTTNPVVVARHGDYDTWFRGSAPADVAWTQVDAGAPLPAASDFDGVLVTGSPKSVRDEETWMLPLGQWLVDAAAGGTPVMAVCFGHQIVGEVLGGRIGTHADGRELGTCAVELTAAGRRDPLFHGLPTILRVQQTHGDLLVEAPTDPGVVRLAGNAHTRWQAFSWGPLLRAVQFHPEAPAAALSHLLEVRGQSAHTVPTPHGPAILANWVDHWVRSDGRPVPG